MARKEGYDKSFASPADYDDGFVMSDAAKVMRNEAISRNCNKQETVNNKADNSGRKTMSLVLNKKPITEYEANKSQKYDDYYWKCSVEEREKMLDKMAEYEYTEDDYDQNVEIQVTERDEVKPSKQEFYAISDFIEQTGADRNIDDPDKIDTHRYVQIAIYNNGVPTSEQLNQNDRYDKSNQPYSPDAVIIAYESIPKGDTHEFWQVDSKNGKNETYIVPKGKYEILKTLSAEESAKYQDVRDGIAFERQVNSGVFPKSLLQLASKLDSKNEGIGGHNGSSGPECPGE